jgi:hypothetical protein
MKRQNKQEATLRSTKCRLQFLPCGFAFELFCGFGAVSMDCTERWFVVVCDRCSCSRVRVLVLCVIEKTNKNKCEFVGRLARVKM